MKLHQARKMAYDVKARHITITTATFTGDIDDAIKALRSNRAVPHKRDNDRRLAETLRRFRSWGGNGGR